MVQGLGSLVYICGTTKSFQLWIWIEGIRIYMPCGAPQYGFLPIVDGSLSVYMKHTMALTHGTFLNSKLHSVLFKSIGLLDIAMKALMLTMGLLL